MRGTHRPTRTVSLFLVSHHGTMDVRYNVVSVGNDVVGICNVVLNVGNDFIGVLDVVTNVGNRYMCTDCKLSLETDGQQRRYTYKKVLRTLKT